MSTWRLTATITHKSWDGPVVKELDYTGETLDDVLDQFETVPPNHIFNLKKHKRTAFKDINGVKHAWKLQGIKREAPIQPNDQVWQEPKEAKTSTLSRLKSWLKDSKSSP